MICFSFGDMFRDAWEISGNVGDFVHPFDQRHISLFREQLAMSLVVNWDRL